jgi:hypothetical protein
MSRMRNRLAIPAVAAAGVFAAALALSPTAAADPATPTNPGVPGLDTLQQFVSSVGVPQLLQSAASALGGVPATVPTPPPVASAAVNLPQATTPATQAPASGPAKLVPTADVNLPTVPGLPVPLPAQLSLPGDLGSAVPGPVPLPNLAPQPAAAPAAPPAAAAAPGASVLPPLLPLSGLP